MRVFRHILVATDFSESSERAVDLAIQLASSVGAELTLVHTWELPTMAYASLEFPTYDIFAPIEEAAGKELDKTLADVRKRLPRANAMLRRGNPAAELVSATAETGADLLVMGTHGRTGAKHLLLGSVAERVVRTAPIPVLTVHGGAARVAERSSAASTHA